MNDDPRSKSTPQGPDRQSSIPDTLQALIFAFVIAMMARGFVLEGFVIPTGSMAPTLMGEHVRWQSPQTGWSYAMDAGATIEAFSRAARQMVDAEKRARSARSPEAAKRERLEGARRAMIARWDPMFGLDAPVQQAPPRARPQKRGGDRVLVLKTLYPFLEPDRYDVVVFKNPTDPVGPTQNFIKRLVGLPSEQLVTVDGDIFSGPLDGPSDALQIARKPEFVQRAVWQPVYDSNYQPTDLARWRQESGRSWWNAPWSPEGDDADWEIGTDRVWRSRGSGGTTLRYDDATWPVTDFNMYNI